MKDSPAEQDDEAERRRDAKCEVLIDELTLLAKEVRAYLARCQPIDWTLLYGPRGTEIKR